MGMVGRVGLGQLLEHMRLRERLRLSKGSTIGGYDWVKIRSYIELCVLYVSVCGSLSVYIYLWEMT